MSTKASDLPYYAARSLLRMFIALGLSVVFTFVYAHGRGPAAGGPASS